MIIIVSFYKFDIFLNNAMTQYEEKNSTFSIFFNLKKKINIASLGLLALSQFPGVGMEAPYPV